MDKTGETADRIQVREYKPSDFKDVKKNLLEGDMYHAVWDDKQNLASMVEKDPESILVADVNKHHAVGNIVIALYGSQASYLFRLAVRKKYRDMGVGTKLLEEAERVLKNKEVKQVAVLVDESDTDLQNYYSKRGYKKASTIYRVMWKSL